MQFYRWRGPSFASARSLRPQRSFGPSSTSFASTRPRASVSETPARQMGVLQDSPSLGMLWSILGTEHRCRLVHIFYCIIPVSRPLRMHPCDLLTWLQRATVFIH